MNIDGAALQRARILIVDDEPANVLLLERLLERAGYKNVISTTESAQALPLCTQSPPDLVLLDLHMPAPDGFEVMRQLDPWIREGALARDRADGGHDAATPGSTRCWPARRTFS